MTFILRVTLIAIALVISWQSVALAAPLLLTVGRRVGHRDTGKGLLALWLHRRVMGRAS